MGKNIFLLSLSLFQRNIFTCRNATSPAMRTPAVAAVPAFCFCEGKSEEEEEEVEVEVEVAAVSCVATRPSSIVGCLRPPFQTRTDEHQGVFLLVRVAHDAVVRVVVCTRMRHLSISEGERESARGATALEMER